MNQKFSSRALRTMLVTGGAGFIGSNFIRYLFAQPDFEGRVVNFDVLTYAGNPANLADLEQENGGPGGRYVFVRGDIRDAEALDRVFADYGIDTVVHFAAESHVDRSIWGPADFVATNVMGTFQLLEAARHAWGYGPEGGGREDGGQTGGQAGSREDGARGTTDSGDQIFDGAGVKCLSGGACRAVGGARSDVLFHHVSTDEVYGSLGAEGRFVETTPYDPRSPYSASKAGSDHLVRAYHHTYGLPVTVSNCSNNYGPWQFPEKLIPLMILNMLEGRELPVYGDGGNVRDWLYVEDHAAALWTILRKAPSGTTYNIGGENEWENIRLVETLCDLTADRIGRPASEMRALIRFVKDRPGHDRRYAIDCDRIKRELDWRPEHDFKSGLERTVDWYLDHRVWVDAVRSGVYLEYCPEDC